MTGQSETERLANQLPDLPRWVEARAALLWERCEILRETPELAAVVRDTATQGVIVIGVPRLDAIRNAAREGGDRRLVVAGWELRDYVAGALPEWRVQRAIIHQLGQAPYVLHATAGSVGFLGAASLNTLEGVPPDLLHDLRIGAEHSPIAATLVDGRPVAFCYAGAITESLWDVSIDTLPGYRRRGTPRCAPHI